MLATHKGGKFLYILGNLLYNKKELLYNFAIINWRKYYDFGCSKRKIGKFERRICVYKGVSLTQMGKKKNLKN
jgi:hypothetical protein